jgi:hypothetical protein
MASAITNRRARLAVRAGAASMIGAAASVALVLSLGVTARPADAGPIGDAEPGAAALVVVRLAEVDAALRASDAALPEAVAAADAALASLEATRAAEAAALTAHPATVPAPGASEGGAVADVAADAILTDLHPERASAERAFAEQAAADAAARRDFLFGAGASARQERQDLLTALEVTGQARTRWSVALLDALGTPVTQENVRALDAWIAAESNTARANNPLATTMGAPGAVDLNDHGVKGYPNDVIGLDATVRTLRNGSYGAILDALAAGDSAVRVAQAVAASPWGTGENMLRRLAMHP